ncbi:MAG: LptF/LptG family permease [Tepidisphaeraceae bacterium]
MKILDRYVLSLFLKNYLISLMVLIGLYVVLDMVFNFDELAELQTASNVGGVSSALSVLHGIADYYFFQCFRIFVHLSGIIPIVAAAFTLIRLTRFNELTASLAAGVPLLRIALPIVIAAGVLNVLLIVDQELIIPRIIPRLTRHHDEIAFGSRAKKIRAMQDQDKALLNAARYHPQKPASPAWMEEMDVIVFDPGTFMPVAHIRADKAEWDTRNRQWNLTEGRIVTGLKPDGQVSGEKPFAAYKSSVTPDEVALFLSGEYVDMLPRSRIKLLLERPKSYGTNDLLRVYHSRWVQPVLNVLLLLLAVPCVMSREPGRVKQGVLLCTVLVGACLSSIFLCYQLAGTPPLGTQWADRWPALMAWAPLIIFGPVAVWLLDRVKS